MSYHPRFTITPTLLGQVESIAVLRERIHGAVVQVPWVPSLQRDTLAQNAHSSTAIEGNPLTLEQARAIEVGEPLPGLDRARREVVNYFAALRHIEKHASKKRMAHEDILRLHAIMAGAVMDQGEGSRKNSTVAAHSSLFVHPARSLNRSEAASRMPAAARWRVMRTASRISSAVAPAVFAM